MVTIAITTDEVERRVVTVGNLEEDKSRSFGGSEGEETGPRVQQEVRDSQVSALHFEMGVK